MNILRPPCLCIGQVSGRKIARKIASLVANAFYLFNGVFMYECEVSHQNIAFREIVNSVGVKVMQGR